ncbi:MAG: hypothetical protein HC898_00520, partial [Phycisphaerales bacterium]|nr:hypothetical protein [Phycisphaerales bacterium]
VFLTCFASYRLYQYGWFRPATYLFIGGLTLTVVSFMAWSIADFSTGAAYLLLLVVAMAGLFKILFAYGGYGRRFPLIAQAIGSSTR